MMSFNSPMLVLATPGMLHGGTSLELFREWCGDSRNKLIVPGYCVAGTIGNLVLQGQKVINISGKNYQVNMEVSRLSFSAHADDQGIRALMRHLSPKRIIFVHGDRQRML